MATKDQAISGCRVISRKSPVTFEFYKQPNILSGHMNHDRKRAMALIIQPETPPLRQDASGGFRVGSSRVLVELVIRAFQDGATPEAIAQRYPTATLADIYAVIAYYLRHRQEVDAYLAEREQQAQEVRQRIEHHQGDLADLRHRILARQRSG